MNSLELVCVVVVAVWFVFRSLAHQGSRRDLYGRALLIAVSAWVAEDSAIRLYGFYAYAPDRWTVWVDQVPLLILLIWPVVVTAAIDLLEALAVRPGRWPGLMGVLVIADAWFIEPAAVDAGLWTWTSPGPFSIPTIGILGWGFFAVGVGVVRWRRWPMMAMPLVAPLVCHALLLLSWWGAFRWIAHPIPELAMAVVGWVAAVVVVSAISWFRPRGLRLQVLLRVPAAVFFFGLLWTCGQDADDGPLVMWCLAFAPPWLTVLLLSTWPASTGSVATAAAR